MRISFENLRSAIKTSGMTKQIITSNICRRRLSWDVYIEARVEATASRCFKIHSAEPGTAKTKPTVIFVARDLVSYRN